MRSIKGISVFLTLAVSLLASTIGAQAQFSSGAPTKLVLINSFNDIASVQPAQNQNSVVVIRYGNSVGDQLGGMFMYDPDSVVAADSKNVFVPASGSGRWVRYDYAAYLPKVQTANRVIVTDGSGNVGTDPQLTFDGTDLTVGGDLTVSTLAAGGTDTVVTHNSNVLQTRTINSDVWNLAADLAGDSENVASGTKLVGPAIYFGGVNDYIEVADSSKLSFHTASGSLQGAWSAATNTPFLTDGTGTTAHYYTVSAAGTQNLGSGAITYAIGDIIKYDGSIWYQEDKDDLAFSISAWVKPSDITSLNPIVSKYSSSGEFLFYFTGGKLVFLLRDASVQPLLSTAALTVSVDEWFHVCVTYAGAGPNKANGFASAASGLKLFVNGEDLTSAGTVSNEAAYSGMPDTTNALQIGRAGSDYYQGHIRDVKIFNRELTASEVAELARGNDLGFADEWGGANGGVGTIDETVGLSSWSGSGSATPTNLTETANTTVGGRPNVLQQQATATIATATKIAITNVASVGKRVRIEFDYYINSGNATLDTIIVASPTATIATLNTAGAWTRASVETVLTSTTVELQITDGATYNATALDFVGFDNFSVTEIGTLADFRAENFDADTGKLYDLSSNAFIGVNSGSTLTGRAYAFYETGTWTPAITFGGGATGLTYGTQEGYYTREGNQVTVHAYIVLTAKGSSTGTALMTSLPFTARNTAGSSQSLSVSGMTNAASLTSPVTAYVTDNGTTVNLVDWGATGAVVLDDTNFTDTSTIKVSGTYQIQ